MTIKVGGSDCLETQWLDESSAKCEVPSGYSAETTRVTVKIGFAEASADLFTYDAPVITSIQACSPASLSSCFQPAYSPAIAMPKSGDGSFTIYGSNFGPMSNGAISIALGDRTCERSTMLNSNMAVCQLGTTGSTATSATTVSLTVGVVTGTSVEGLYSF